MKKTIIAVFTSALVLLSVPLFAEIYKYTDENGQKRWTDDLSQVPIDQRAAAQRIESISGDSPDTDTRTGEGISSTAPREPGIIGTDTGTAGQDSNLTREALEEEKADLDRQYQELLEERKELEKMKAEPLDASARGELNEKITAFNAKTDQYESQLNAFNEKINIYNQTIKTEQASPKE